jgi:DNA polymerase III subunit gamma/tau
VSRPYKVLALKYRPQHFGDVVGQEGVTRTLRNAITRKRLAQSYIFAGARGVGKTTTARILARALNCVNGPTPDPCGTCDACVEIAEGRDLDVFEIDAASNTGVDNVRDVIISSLAIAPARDRFKVFIIDEVHMLSNSSFNALLKSVEEPPPHVVFMMATTELQKIPDTIRSRSQEFEFRSIGATHVAAQLRMVADLEQVDIDADALLLIARAAEGSMRDALSAFDQVIAFAGERITAADVSAVLGLVARDALLDLVEIVADARAADVFTAVGQLVESGQDLKLVCRELTALVRDLLVVRIDESRLQDAELAPDAARLADLAARFSREDLLRAFDVLAKAEADIRFATQPRHHVEMALLRWIHLGHLQPLTDLIASLGGSVPGGGRPAPARAAAIAAPVAPAVRQAVAPRVDPTKVDTAPTPTSSRAVSDTDEPPVVTRTSGLRRPGAPLRRADTARPAGPIAQAFATSDAVEPSADAAATAGAAARVHLPPSAEVLVEALRKGNRTFFGTTLARAAFDVSDGRCLITLPGKFELQRLEARRAWVEETAEQLFGVRLRVDARVDATPAVAAAETAAQGAQQRLRAQALESEAVQAMLDVFPAEISDVEEIADEGT